MVLIQNDHILMVHQRYRDRMIWTFPDGSIEEGETPAEAAIREVREEVNLVTAIVRRLHHQPRIAAAGTYYCYLGSILAGEVRLGVEPELVKGQQELQAVKWFRIEDIASHPEVALVMPLL